MTGWKLTSYRVANPGWRVGINRVCGVRLGWYVVIGKRCFSLANKRPLTMSEINRWATQQISSCKHIPFPHDPYRGEGATCSICGSELVSDGPGYDGEQTWTTA